MLSIRAARGSASAATAVTTASQISNDDAEPEQTAAQQVRSVFELLQHISAASQDFQGAEGTPVNLLKTATSFSYLLMQSMKRDEAAEEERRGDPEALLSPMAAALCRAAIASYGFTRAAFLRALRPTFSKDSLVFDHLYVANLRPAHAILVSKPHKAIVIAIRGTASLSDLATDLAGRPVTFSDVGSCHTGIAACTASLFSDDYGQEVVAHLKKKGLIALSPEEVKAAATPSIFPASPAVALKALTSGFGGGAAAAAERAKSNEGSGGGKGAADESDGSSKSKMLTPLAAGGASIPAAWEEGAKKNEATSSGNSPATANAAPSASAKPPSPSPFPFHQGIVDVVWRLLEQPENSGFSVFFTGHSLGASVCAAACLRLRALLHQRAVYEELTTGDGNMKPAAVTMADLPPDLLSMCLCRVPVHAVCIATPACLTPNLAALGSLTAEEARLLATTTAKQSNRAASERKRDGKEGDDSEEDNDDDAAEDIVRHLLRAPSERYAGFSTPVDPSVAHIPTRWPIIQSVVTHDDFVPRTSIASAKLLHAQLNEEAMVRKASAALKDAFDEAKKAAVDKVWSALPPNLTQGLSKAGEAVNEAQVAMAAKWEEVVSSPKMREFQAKSKEAVNSFVSRFSSSASTSAAATSSSLMLLAPKGGAATTTVTTRVVSSSTDTKDIGAAYAALPAASNDQAVVDTPSTGATMAGTIAAVLPTELLPQALASAEEGAAAFETSATSGRLGVTSSTGDAATSPLRRITRQNSVSLDIDELGVRLGATAGASGLGAGYSSMAEGDLLRAAASSSSTANSGLPSVSGVMDVDDSGDDDDDEDENEDPSCGHHKAASFFQRSLPGDNSPNPYHLAAQQPVSPLATASAAEIRRAASFGSDLSASVTAPSASAAGDPTKPGAPASAPPLIPGTPGSTAALLKSSQLTRSPHFSALRRLIRRLERYQQRSPLCELDLALPQVLVVPGLIFHITRIKPSALADARDRLKQRVRNAAAKAGSMVGSSTPAALAAASPAPTSSSAPVASAAPAGTTDAATGSGKPTTAAAAPKDSGVFGRFASKLSVGWGSKDKGGKKAPEAAAGAGSAAPTAAESSLHEPPTPTTMARVSTGVTSSLVSSEEAGPGGEQPVPQDPMAIKSEVESQAARALFRVHVTPPSRFSTILVSTTLWSDHSKSGYLATLEAISILQGVIDPPADVEAQEKELAAKVAAKRVELGKKVAAPTAIAITATAGMIAGAGFVVAAPAAMVGGAALAAGAAVAAGAAATLHYVSGKVVEKETAQQQQQAIKAADGVATGAAVTVTTTTREVSVETMEAVSSAAAVTASADPPFPNTLADVAQRSTETDSKSMDIV